jgi:hypothetical protein
MAKKATKKPVAKKPAEKKPAATKKAAGTKGKKTSRLPFFDKCSDFNDTNMVGVEHYLREYTANGEILNQPSGQNKGKPLTLADVQEDVNYLVGALENCIEEYGEECPLADLV